MPSHLNRMAGMASVPMLVSWERNLVATQASLEDFLPSWWQGNTNRTKPLASVVLPDDTERIRTT